MARGSKQQGRAPIARHASLRSPGPLRQALVAAGAAVAVAVVSVFGVAAYALYDLGSSFTADAVVLDGQEQSPPDIGELDNGQGVNILLTGLDACEDSIKGNFGSRCDPDVTYGDEAKYTALDDVNMLIHVSPEPRRVTVVSFPRDLMLPIPECTNYEGTVTAASDYVMLNESNARGGIDCSIKTIEALADDRIDIEYGATITWGGVIDLTRAIGGVTVCVGENGLHDPEAGIDLEPGANTISDWDALAFLRTRHGIDDGSDYGRISNQQVYMSALARKLTSEEVLTNPGTLLRLAKAAMENVDPSTSLTDPLTLARIAAAVSDVPLSDFVFVQYPTFEDPNDSNRAVPDTETADYIWSAFEANTAIDPGGIGRGAVLADGSDGATSAPTDSASPTDGATDSSTGEPTDGATVNNANLFGQDANEQTCSNGNG